MSNIIRIKAIMLLSIFAILLYSQIILCAESTVYYVSVSSGSDSNAGTRAHPFASVTRALHVTEDGAAINVATGTYNESITMSNSIELRGGYSNDFAIRDSASFTTILQGTTAAPVISINGVSGVTIDGFTITGGQKGIQSAAWPPVSNITISNNIIENNGEPIASGNHFGGGIYLGGPDLVIENNIIRNNVAGKGPGITLRSNSENVLVKGNTISNNIGYSDHGGGIYNSAMSSFITENIIEGNRIGDTPGYGWGGGMIIDGGVDDNPRHVCESSYNIYRNNYAGRGAAIHVDEGSYATFTHDLFYNNESGSSGAAIVVDERYNGDPSFAHIENCTIVNNAGPQGGNGVEIDRSRAEVINCIFAGNGDDFHISTATTIGDAALTVTYSLSEESWTGEGNISGDPLFVDTANADFHLLTTSPAIDAGDPASDYSNEPMDNGGRVNMGRYGNTDEATSIDGQVAKPPVANFSASSVSGDAPLEVSFTDTSTNSPTSWSWDFNGDGAVDSTDKNPVHTYIIPGTYTVRLTVENADGYDTVERTDFITVNEVISRPRDMRIVEWCSPM